MTKVDTTNTKYHEADTAPKEFTSQELRHCRMLLRRLHFLESKVEASGGLGTAGASGGAAFAEWEMIALEFVLTDNGFLKDIQVSRNTKDRN